MAGFTIQRQKTLRNRFTITNEHGYACYHVWGKLGPLQRLYLMDMNSYVLAYIEEKWNQPYFSHICQGGVLTARVRSLPGWKEQSTSRRGCQSTLCERDSSQTRSRSHHRRTTHIKSRAHVLHAGADWRTRIRTGQAVQSTSRTSPEHRCLTNEETRRSPLPRYHGRY